MSGIFGSSSVSFPTIESSNIGPASYIVGVMFLNQTNNKTEAAGSNVIYRTAEPPMQVYNLCLVAEDVRLEIGNKASIIGFYGRLPWANISVANPTLPIYRLTFLFISDGPVKAGLYSVRVSVKDPTGQELMSQVDAVSSEATFGVLNTIIACQPFLLHGVGQYRVTAIVNGVDDYSSTLTIQV